MDPSQITIGRLLGQIAGRPDSDSLLLELDTTSGPVLLVLARGPTAAALRRMLDESGEVIGETTFAPPAPRAPGGMA